MTDSRLDDLTGKRFGYWKVLDRLPDKPGSGHVRWRCRCKCGREYPVFATHLKSGTSTRCMSCRSRGA